eukprot:7781749-Heterocapsa_arctica.AAC.1
MDLCDVVGESYVVGRKLFAGDRVAKYQCKIIEEGAILEVGVLVDGVETLSEFLGCTNVTLCVAGH